MNEKQETIADENNKRPVGNAAAMREALEMMISLFSKGVLCTSYADTIEEMEQIEELYRKAKAALSEPQRNCDVGTAEDQTTRYRKFCIDHKYLGSDFSYMCKGFGKGRCPFSNSHIKSQCEFAWAQMPYESEVNT